MKKSLIALFMTTFLLSGQTKVDAADIYNNIGQAVFTNSGLNDATWAALSFLTTPSGYVITGVNFPLRNPNNLSSGTITLSLYTATGTASRPGTKIGSDLGSTSIVGYSPTVYQDFSITGLNITLSPSTNYYLVASSTGASGNYNVGVNNTGGGLITGSLGFSDTLNSGASWSAPSTGFYFIGSVTATPEPSTWALGAIATGTVATLVRRRKRQQA